MQLRLQTLEERRTRCASGGEIAAMITGRWGKPSEVLLDIVVEPDGVVRGVANPGNQDAPIRRGQFDAATGAVHLEGEHVRPDGMTMPFKSRRASRSAASAAWNAVPESRVLPASRSS